MNLLNCFSTLPLHFYSWNFRGFKTITCHIEKASQWGPALGNSLGENLQQHWFQPWVRCDAFGLPHILQAMFVGKAAVLCVGEVQRSAIPAQYSAGRKWHQETSVKKENKLFPGCSCGSAADFSLETVYGKYLVKLLFFAACDEFSNLTVGLWFSP